MAFLFYVIVLFMASEISIWAGENVVPISENKAIARYNPQPGAKIKAQPPGIITDSPGVLVGYTQYDSQTNGSSGNRCAVDGNGGVYFAWTNGISYPSQRAVYFNYVDSSGNWLSPVGISQVNMAGYCQIAVTNDNRAAVAYHSAGNPGIENYVIYAEEESTGSGNFEYFDPPDTLLYRCFWPYICVDRSDNIHIVLCENNPVAGGSQVLGYTVSTDGGFSWSALIEVDTLLNVSQSVVASPVSDKVAIFFTHPCDTTTQWKNDIYYIESQDGLTWDWQFGKINLTNYGAPDSLYAYTDLTVVYDYNDDLNVVWNAQWVSDAGTYEKTFLLHYNSGSGTVTQLRDTPESWPPGCSYGAWNRAISRMSLGIQPNTGNIFVVYTAFDSTDCSAGGFANGEVHMQYSSDNGNSWSTHINLTNSPTPGCSPGDCDSDHWSTLADAVDEHLHIVYINDKDAGSIIHSEGQITNNPVNYLEVENPLWTLPGEIAGTVVNQDTIPVGAAYLRATGTIIDDSTGSGGDYTLEKIHEGNYDIVCSHPDYQDTTISGVIVNPGNTTILNITLREPPPVCDYEVGDVNGVAGYNGLDITYGVSYFKGGNPPLYECECTPGNTWYVSGDVNGDCLYNGLDIGYGVNYLKGGPGSVPCPDCPPLNEATAANRKNSIYNTHSNRIK